MAPEMRKEYAQLHSDLVAILTKCDNDAQYFRRLTWALEFISNDINQFNLLFDDHCDINTDC